jgi:hypothetical protein
MRSYCLKTKQVCQTWINLTSIGLTLNICSIISCLVTIIYFGVQLGGLHKYNYIYDYKDAQCPIVSGRVADVTCPESDIPHRWIAIFSTSSGSEVIENPFAVRDYRSLALQDLNHLRLNSTYPCVCRSYLALNSSLEFPTEHGCAVWTSCILSVDFIKYIQHDTNRYYQTYVSFMATSLVSIVLSVAYLPISIKTLRELRRQQNYIPL